MRFPRHATNLLPYQHTRPWAFATRHPSSRRVLGFHDDGCACREQGGLLRRMVADGGKVQRVAAGLAWLKRNVARPIRMEELAREMRMSPSAMHSWFRAVTSMSPLQYQKQLRLQDARRILLSESLDAGTVSRRVGYESASHFSREYRRFFGAPPMPDIERLSAASDLR
jgi:transcriptional regulator GlxA family with amidase domain